VRTSGGICLRWHSNRVTGEPEATYPTVDVVIPTYDGWHLLERCLGCLRAQTLPHRVIIVDNGSTDGTLANVRRSFPEALLVELATNGGFPVACNRGVAAGESEVIVLLNNDVEPRPDFLEELVQPLIVDGSVGSVAGVLLQRDGEAIDSVGLSVDRTLAGYPRLRGAPAEDAAAVHPVLVGPAGGAGAYRRSAWEGVGGLDEGVLGYGEDVDVAMRLWIAGWGARAAPTAIGIHLGSASFGRRSIRQRYHSGFARGYFLRRYGVLRTTAAARTIATEAAVIVGDALISRDLSAARGRIAGWRAAYGAPRRPLPPAGAIDPTITFWESLRLRRRVYAT
jgi:N-acetylglucosaminyl-diphospho-decaprenol L-rhamnosyltransferase